MSRLSEISNLPSRVQGNNPSALDWSEGVEILRALRRGVPQKEINKILGKKNTVLAQTLGQWAIRNADSLLKEIS